MDYTTFALAGVALGALFGGITGRSDTRFWAGFGFGLLVICTAVFFIVSTVALGTGVNVLGGLVPYITLCTSLLFVAYALVFWVVRRYWSKPRTGPSGNAT